jgi:hypothetical protein
LQGVQVTISGQVWGQFFILSEAPFS